MLFKQLKYFETVARLQSFTAAANECFISQSAISQQIKQLEDYLGVALIERKGKNFELTAEGKFLQKKAKRLLEEASRIRFELLTYRDPASTLRIGVLNRYDEIEIEQALTAFSAKHPNCVITVTALNHEQLYSGILENQFDLLVSDRRRALSDKFQNVKLFNADCFIEVSPASALYGKSEVDIDELRSQTGILISDDEKAAISEERFFHDVLNFSSHFIFAKNLSEARMMVAANQGYLPVDVKQGSNSDSRFRRIPLTESGFQRQREYYAFWLKNVRNPLIEEFTEMLALYCKK